MSDLSQGVEERLPVFLVAVVAMSFLLLMVLFRSVVVPLKAAILNLLSVAAAYGVLVMAFQWGWAASLIGLESTVPGWLDRLLPKRDPEGTWDLPADVAGGSGDVDRPHRLSSSPPSGLVLCARAARAERRRAVAGSGRGQVTSGFLIRCGGCGRPAPVLA